MKNISFFKVFFLAIVLLSVSACGSDTSSRREEVSSRALNDTGITFGGNYPSGNNTTCIAETIAQQDCSLGTTPTAVITVEV